MIKFKYITVLLSAIMLLSACQTAETTEQGTEDLPEDSLGIENEDFAVSFEEALQMFREEVGEEDIQFQEITFNDENSYYTYQIRGDFDNREYGIEINADSGEIIESQSQNVGEDDEESTIVLENIIPPQDAMQVAIEETEEGYATGWTLETQEDRAVYNISIENDEDRAVDANTGELSD